VSCVKNKMKLTDDVQRRDNACERFVIYNEIVGGREMVITDEERILRGG